MNILKKPLKNQNFLRNFVDEEKRLWYIGAPRKAGRDSCRVQNKNLYPINFLKLVGYIPNLINCGLLSLLCLIFFLTNISNSLSQENYIIARINRRAITSIDLADRYLFSILISKIKATSNQDRDLITNQLLKKMIDEELINQEAGHLKIEAAQSEIEELLDHVATQHGKNSAQFKEFLLRNKISFENYSKQIESEILWSKIISELLKPKIKITEVELKEFFEQNKFDVDVKKISLSEILISTSGKNSLESDFQLAKKLQTELSRGVADFRNVVKQFSDAINSEHGGEVGWVSKFDIDPKIYSEISKLHKGEYSEPILLADGYHVFRLNDSRTEIKIPDQSMREAQDVIRARKLQNMARGYLMDLRKKSFIEVDDRKSRPPY